MQERENSGYRALKTQKANITCKSMRRFADCVLNTPPASAVDCPKSDELKLPIGGAGLTLLNRLRAFALKVRLYRWLDLSPPKIPPIPPRGPPPIPPGPPP